jgi:hypothetical protein
MVTGQTYQPQYYQSYTGYQPYPQPVIQQPSQTIQNQILVWVQSEEEATKFPLSTGQSIFLMNQNADYLYMKSVDQLGKTTFIKKKLIDETERKANENEIDLSGYMRREDVENLINEVIQKEVEKRVSEMSFKATRTKRKAED